MIYNFQNFLNEATKNRKYLTYWNESILKENWLNLNIEKNPTTRNSYYLNISVKEEGDESSLILDVINGKEKLLYYKPDLFWKKFNQEFGKNPQLYLPKLEYVPLIIQKNFKELIDSTNWGLV